MAIVQIRDKRKVIDIMCEDEKLGEIKFNPDDTRTYSRFIELIETLTNGKREVDNVKFSDDELKLLSPSKNTLDNEENGDDLFLSKRLETAEDFELAASLFEKMKRTTGIAVDTWDSVCKGLDEIFGAGVCDIFTQGALDPELITPLIDAVMPFFKEARQSKANQYKKNA